MRCKHWMLVLAFLPVAALGCGGSGDSGDNPSPDNSETQGEAAAPSNDAQAAPIDTSHPAGAVTAFLEALRKGDDEKVMAMYTARAREQAKFNEFFAPRGSDTAEFQVGQVQNLAEHLARVATRWIDLDQNGERQSLDFVWLVRNEPEGWRLAGMEFKVPGLDDQPPVTLDFENLEETIRKVDTLAEEIRRDAMPEQVQRLPAADEIDQRAEIEAARAQRPGISPDSLRR